MYMQTIVETTMICERRGENKFSLSVLIYRWVAALSSKPDTNLDVWTWRKCLRSLEAKCSVGVTSFFSGYDTVSEKCAENCFDLLDKNESILSVFKHFQSTSCFDALTCYVIEDFACRPHRRFCELFVRIAKDSQQTVGSPKILNKCPPITPIEIWTNTAWKSTIRRVISFHLVFGHQRPCLDCERRGTSFSINGKRSDFLKNCQ